MAISNVLESAKLNRLPDDNKLVRNVHNIAEAAGNMATYMQQVESACREIMRLNASGSLDDVRMEAIIEELKRPTPLEEKATQDTLGVSLRALHDQCESAMHEMVDEWNWVVICGGEPRT